MYFIERDQKILGQKKKLYYSGSRTWTTHYDRRKLYKTYDEANKENEQFLRDILYIHSCLLYTSPSPRDRTRSRMPSSA